MPEYMQYHFHMEREAGYSHWFVSLTYLTSIGKHWTSGNQRR